MVGHIIARNDDFFFGLTSFLKYEAFRQADLIADLQPIYGLFLYKFVQKQTVNRLKIGNIDLLTERKKKMSRYKNKNYLFNFFVPLPLLQDKCEFLFTNLSTMRCVEVPKIISITSIPLHAYVLSVLLEK